jgi:hypothetical protein
MPQGLRRKAGFCFAQIRKRSRVTGAGLSIRSPGKRSFPLSAFSSGFTGRAFLWRKAAAREVFPAPASGREQQGGFPPCGIRAGRQGGFRGRSGVPNHLPGGRETQISFRKKCLYRKAGDSELQSSGLPHKGQTSFTEYPGKRLGISSSRGCPIRHRFLSRRTL